MIRRAAAVVLLVAAATLTGCSSTVSLEPADAANDPLCAAVTANLPPTVDGQPRVWTDAQATGAWGSPAKVLLTCGVTPPGPTTLRCETVSSVDWIIDESEAPRFRVTTFGRTPAVELYIETGINEDDVGVSSRQVLDVLSPIIAGALPKDAECVPRAEATPVPEPVEP